VWIVKLGKPHEEDKAPPSTKIFVIWRWIARNHRTQSMATIKYYVSPLQLVNKVPFIFSLKQISTLYPFGCLWVIGKTQYEVVENQGGHSSYPQAVAPCITVTTRTARSQKHRPCLRRGGKNWVETAASRDEAEVATRQQEPDLVGMSLIHNNNGQVADVFGVPFTDSSQQSNNNYLDFLLHSEGSSPLESIQVFSPELDTFLTSSYQWEKLPTLYPEDSSRLLHDKNKTDSSSPESVITCFAADVFDSLETLCPAPTEWWVVWLT
jgi:hypothetical protein